MYKLKKIFGPHNFSPQLLKIIYHYKKIGYNISVLQQNAYLVVNKITVGNFLSVGCLFLGYSVCFTVESLCCFISFLYLDLYVLGDDAMIS